MRVKIKSGQVWIETVLYTLIGLTLIGLVLGFVMPKINERRDALLVEQSIQAVQVFDEKIQEVAVQSAGSRRIISDFTLKRGEMKINGRDNKIELFLEGLDSPYSEPGKVVNYGKVEVLTEKGQKYYNVSLSIPYSSTNDIAYDDDKLKIQKFGSAATPYQFSVEHKTSEDSSPYINIKEISGKSGG